MKNKYSLYIYILCAILTLNYILFSFFLIPSETVRIYRLTQFFGLTAFTFLYLRLTIDPFLFTFKNFPFKNMLYAIKKPVLISSVYFALLHSSTGFFLQLGGFSGLPFLSSTYLNAIIISFCSLLTLILLVIISLKEFKNKYYQNIKKQLGIFLYLCGILILIHIVMLGTHFQDLNTSIPQVMVLFLSALLLLEFIRFDNYIKSKFKQLALFTLPSLILFGALIALITLYLLPSKGSSSLGFNIHTEHQKIARQAQNLNDINTTINNPALIGDRTRRYTVSFFYPDSISKQEEVELRFRVYDAATGEEVKLFNRIYDKLIHLIVTDNSLTYFSHIHPELDGSEFVIKTTFPKDGTYRLYADFQPFGAIEQQFGFSVNVGSDNLKNISRQIVDKNLSKNNGEYITKLSYDAPLSAKKLSVGEQELTFTVLDAKNNKGVRTLKPYLASFGHLVLINQKTYEYIHVHPTNLRAPMPNQNGGPEVKFLPIGINGPIKPGVYRAFVQFNPDNKLYTQDFTINIQ